MIKRIGILILLCLFVSAQTNKSDENINIKELVQKQIKEAKKKGNENKIINSVEKTPIEERQTKYVNVAETDNPLLGKIIVLSSFSTILLSIVVFRRKRRNKSSGPIIDLKANVKLMREEKFIKPIDPKLKKIRTNLCLNSKYLNNNDVDITSTARKYNIAKTELVLAARFRNEILKAN